MPLRIISPIVILYICGLVATQIHRQELGITEIAALDTYYLLTGAAFAICLLPATLAIGGSELSLAAWPAMAKLRTASKPNKRTYARTFAPAALLLGFCVVAIVWFIAQRPEEVLFDFRLYDLPRYYVGWNLVALNIGIVLVWLALLILLRLGVISRRSIGKHLLAPIFVLAVSLVYWSRTIYPAIDPSLGGSAPKLAFIQTQADGPGEPVVLLLSGEQGIYYHAIDDAPDFRRVHRSENYLWCLASDASLVKTLLANEVTFLPRSRLLKLTVMAGDRTEQYEEVSELEKMSTGDERSKKDKTNKEDQYTKASRCANIDSTAVHPIGATP